MAFAKVDRSIVVPRRHWLIVGPAGCGKSTFAARMKSPIICVDADHRWQEVSHWCDGDTYLISEDAATHNDANKIIAALDAGMPGIRAGTVLIDSISSILQPVIGAAMADTATTNRLAIWRDKALTVRGLQDATTKWGADVLWIAHEHQRRNQKGELETVLSIPTTELARLRRSLNLIGRIITDQAGRRSLRVEWSRSGRTGVQLDDRTGNWDGAPEELERLVYAGLSLEDQTSIAKSTPVVFTSIDHALAWAMEADPCPFESIRHAPVASLNWPAMTMDFILANPALTDKLKAGAPINIEFVERGPGEWVITKMAAKSAGTSHKGH